MMQKATMWFVTVKNEDGTVSAKNGFVYHLKIKSENAKAKGCGNTHEMPKQKVF